MHYYQITCGLETASGSFRTSNIPWGQVYSEPAPADASNPGNVAWPTLDWDLPSTSGPSPLSSAGTTITSAAHGLAAGDFIALDSGPKRGETRRVVSVTGPNSAQIDAGFSSDQSGVAWRGIAGNYCNNPRTAVDPQSGVLMRRMTCAEAWWRVWPQGVDSVKDLGGSAWVFTTPGDEAGDLNSRGSRSATYGGSGGSGPGPWLLVRMTGTGWPDSGHQYSSADDRNPVMWVKVAANGSAVGSGDDAMGQYCLTVDGMHCETAIKEVNLSTCGSDCMLGDETPYLKFWEDPAEPLRARLQKWDVYYRTGTATYMAATKTLRWSSGQYFNPVWTNGSEIVLTVAGTPRSYTVASVDRKDGYRQITLADGTGLSDGASYAFTAPNFGLLLRKKTATLGTSVSLDYVGFTLGTAVEGAQRWDWGGMVPCSTNLVAQIYKGAARYGYHCTQPAGGTKLAWWVDPNTADTVLLGVVQAPSTADWTGGANTGADMANWSYSDGNRQYATAPRTADGETASLQLSYSGDNLHKRIQYGGVYPDPMLGGNWQQILPTGVQTAAGDFTQSNDPTGPQFDRDYYSNTTGATCTPWAVASASGITWCIAA